ncbi:platelet endothelial cell adhesion molecule [Oryzias latipes]|uniref:Platelet and endothelial cell adhesion molecule 1a n=1 Tax=Oryzias latipes TaxID=8090 RepID=H2MAB9_ORYLA|nr:platelet endothelial cell adhesion molecule [Oryzias latipes]
MGSKPPGLQFLSILLIFWQSAGEESSYIIDSIGLTIQPKNAVERGTPVLIGCHVSVSHSNIPDLENQFQILKDEVPIYSFNTTNSTVLYELNPARAADSGSYECRVTVKDKSKASFSERLDVTGLQTPSLFLNNSKPFENEEFEASCSAPGEKGLFIFRFYLKFRTGEPQTIKQLQTNGNSTKTLIKLRHIGDCYLSCDYEISLLSGNKRSNSSNETHVTVKVLNITPVVIVYPSDSVFEGDVVEVICRVVDGPDVEVFLTKDKRILKKVPGKALSHMFTAQERDSGEYVCKAEWGNVQKENYKTIKVKELFSKPKLILEPVDLFEGDRFKLTCKVTIYVPQKIDNNILTYSFYRDNTKIITSNSYISMAHPNMNGNYTCKANASSLGNSFIKESQALVVKAKVPVSKPVLSIVGGTLLLGKPFQLLCQSNSGTLPISYTLYGPAKLNESKVVSKPGDMAIFNCPAIFKSLDLSKFLCHARNHKNKVPMIGSGQLMLKSTNIIEPVSNPELKVDSSEVSEGHSVILNCSVQRGTSPISFTWFHTEKGGPLASLSTNKTEGSFRINNVNGEHGGRYYCMSTNPAKDNKKSNIVMIGVKMAGWKKGLIALFCILIILPLVLVISFKVRLIQCRRRSTGRLSVKSASTKVERLSLTLAEVNEAANVTPGMMGKSIWSEHMSGSESDDHVSTVTQENPEPQYTEVQTKDADPSRAPVKQGTDTVYSEVRNSQQGVPDINDGVSLEYAQLNHDNDPSSDNCNHGDPSTNADEKTDVNTCVSDATAEQEEGKCDAAPEC